MAEARPILHGGTRSEVPSILTHDPKIRVHAVVLFRPRLMIDAGLTSSTRRRARSSLTSRPPLAWPREPSPPSGARAGDTIFQDSADSRFSCCRDRCPSAVYLCSVDGSSGTRSLRSLKAAPMNAVPNLSSVPRINGVHNITSSKI